MTEPPVSPPRSSREETPEPKPYTWSAAVFDLLKAGAYGQGARLSAGQCAYLVDALRSVSPAGPPTPSSEK